MLRIARYTLVAASITLALLGCQDATAPDDATRSLSARPMMSDAPSADLVEHVVAPKATDLLIDRALADHYAWLDTKVPSNHKLLVFMPSARGTPATFTLVAKEGARLGYHVIGLMYQNDVVLAQACPRAPDPSSCYENVRLDVLDGGDRSFPVADVSEANSIDNRLTKLLLYLDSAYPDEGWSRFLKHGEPRWSRIAVAGHSQGGGQAAMIAKIRRVARYDSRPDATRDGLPALDVYVAECPCGPRGWRVSIWSDARAHHQSAAADRRIRAHELAPQYGKRPVHAAGRGRHDAETIGRVALRPRGAGGARR